MIVMTMRVLILCFFKNADVILIITNIVIFVIKTIKITLTIILLNIITILISVLITNINITTIITIINTTIITTMMIILITILGVGSPGDESCGPLDLFGFLASVSPDL